MREIRFRGKCSKTKEWVYGYPVKRGSDWNIFYETVDWYGSLGKITYHQVRVIEKTIGQSTGIRDRFGKEVFEGDIDKNGYLLTYVDHKRSETLDIPIGFYRESKTFRVYDRLEAKDREWLEIAGSLTETPELLKTLQQTKGE